MKAAIALVFLSFSNYSFGNEEKLLEKTKDKIEQNVKQAEEAVQNTRTLREQNEYFGLINYAPLDLIIPSKLGVTIGLVKDADTTWEIEYLRGSVSIPFLVDDLGSMTDQRLSLIRRSYLGSNSFNISYGISYYDFKIHLGDEILSRLSSGTVPSIDLIRIQSLGFNFALGNRWHFKRNMTFGVDWISWSQPLVITNKDSIFLDYATNPQDRDDVDTALKLLSYFPRFSFFKVQLGILF